MITEVAALSISLLVFVVIGPAWILWLLLAFAASPAPPRADISHD